MPDRIAIIQAHPDPGGGHLCHALAQAYADGAHAAGREVRVVVTMGMPALVYRWYFRAHSVKALERNILGFVGIGPIHETLIGGVDGLGDAGVQHWLQTLGALGKRGD